MKSLNYHNQKGFTLMEIAITLAIVVAIAAVSVNVYFNLKEKYAIQKDVDSVVSTIERTRNMSLNRKNDSAYGVSFASTSAIIFSGSSRSSGNDILKYDLDGSVKISSISLTANKQEISFTKTIGVPSATGTIILSTPSYSKTITISATGIIESK